MKADTRKKIFNYMANWKSVDDEGIYLDEDHMLERVPEWAYDWTHIESNSVEDLQREFNDYYEGLGLKLEVLRPNDFQGLLDLTLDYKFVIECSDGTDTPIEEMDNLDI